MWRQVDCSYQPENPAPVRDTTMYATALPDSSQDLHRTTTDWTGHLTALLLLLPSGLIRPAVITAQL